MAAPDLPRPDDSDHAPVRARRDVDGVGPEGVAPRADGPDGASRDGIGTGTGARPDAAAPDAAEGLAIFDEQTHDDADVPARSPRLGIVVLVLAVVLVALDGLAIALLAGDAVTAAASIALVTMLASIGAGVVALVAVATRRGRWPAVAAVLLSVLANPFVFVWLLGRLVPSL